ncbi:MAG: 5-amino-6-(D-ribitylamino)uracil--L-tyrosine 4-hydroxyphenyl transferase CofH [Burkholderiaceae bacterium]|nr:5-amino-6-(D-ribitylamino)uracil--L-tyrosine 4-hydroxyphenyl transferase CofH [Burkholderiaceae bacterium]
MTMSNDFQSNRIAHVLQRALVGERPNAFDALALAECDDIAALMTVAGFIRDRAFGDAITWSRKVFIPLSHLCRDRCGYCAYAHPPQDGQPAYLSPDEVLAIAEAGQRAGCKEALFTLGDRPETRYRAARDTLRRLGYRSTLDYVAAMARLVVEHTALLPHLNPGVMSRAQIDALRPLALSMGLMLESSAERLAAYGGPHHGCPDKRPASRLATIAAAGAASVPFTSGILVGIGETRLERIASLLELRDLDDRYGHLQEVIVQNFRAKPGTRMAHAPSLSFGEHLWTIAVARIVFGPNTHIQAPPNLAVGPLQQLIDAGIDDWGGVSPVTADHVNPEAPWPQVEQLAQASAAAGKVLVERLAAHPRWITDPGGWIDPALHTRVLRASDADGLARVGDWAPGRPGVPPREPAHPLARPRTPMRLALERALDDAVQGRELGEDQIAALLRARGADFWRVCEAADALRRQVCAEVVGYVVTRNITYTNLCGYRCGFCAFSRGRTEAPARDAPYELDADEIARRSADAWASGATEVCIQGGIRRRYDAGHYLDIVRAVKRAAPAIHVHAFSPLEIHHGAAASGIGVREFLAALRDAGLGSLPGTAAEILDEEVRRVICPDKLSTDEWLEVVGTAHDLGLRSTATMMFGHVDRPEHWARHLLHLRRLQVRSGGFTEFVPLPFVADATPLFASGAARAGATLREAVLVHAVARLALHPLVPNIQGSWVKLGEEVMRHVLQAGANDFGGTLMEESISRAAGALHGQAMDVVRIERVVRDLGRTPRQRTTLYGDAAEMRLMHASPALHGAAA